MVRLVQSNTKEMVQSDVVGNFLRRGPHIFVPLILLVIAPQSIIPLHTYRYPPKLKIYSPKPKALTFYIPHI